MTGRHRWTPPQELFLEIEVDNKPILVDPANVNNRVKEGAWQQVTQDVNKTFGLTLTRQQVRKKYNEIKLKKKAKVTKAVEKGKMADGRLVAASMGQFKKYGRDTSGEPPMFPPPQDVPDEETETDTEYGDNYLLHKTPSRMKVMEPRQRKSIFAFASSEGIEKDYEEKNNKEKTNDDSDEEPSMQRDGDTTDSSTDNIPPKK